MHDVCQHRRREVAEFMPVRDRRRFRRQQVDFRKLSFPASEKQPHGRNARKSPAPLFGIDTSAQTMSGARLSFSSGIPQSHAHVPAEATPSFFSCARYQSR